MFGWLVAPICALLILAGTYSVGYVHGKATVQIAWDSANVQALEEQRDKEAALQADMDKLREDKNRETAKLRSTVAALTDSLRSRPERPAGAVGSASSPAAAAHGCTGAELYAQDGEFLVREAARAEAIRIAMIQCQKAYENASH